MNKDDLVVVGTFGSVIDAEVAKSALDAADVDSFIQADDAGGMRPHMTFAQGARLVVRSSDVDRAKSILAEGPQ